ncbi:MAG TPA: PAS domain S-box protein [Terriglobales bacterium]|nr:PAS domain S-box protein [Terriglobales bacterium]
MKPSSWREHPVIRYGESLLFALAALALWSLVPPFHAIPFLLFLSAVLLSARLCGFGPAILTTLLSVAILDYVVFTPHVSLTLAETELIQLAVFLLVALLASSLARQQSRADLRAQSVQRQLADIVESSQDAILSKDVNGIVASWNGGAERLYGYRADEIIGKHVSILAPPEQPDEIPRIMADLKRGERVQQYRTERVHKDGRRLTVFLSISPLRDDHGKVVGASTIAQDITAQVRAEETLRKSEKLATAGRLAATIAHEINNPLEAIGNLLYLARRDKRKADEYLSMAERELGRVAAIAQQTLGFVRDPTSVAPVDVGAMIDEVLNLHTRQLRAKEIEIRTRYDRTAQITGFAGELRQLFSNVIGNAIEALPQRGSLRVRAQDWQEPTNSRRSGVRVTVADNGSGISLESMTHIFEPFFTTKKDTGTGLGLWLSYSIVQKHGGWIRVRSRADQGRSGTIFSIFLPENVEPSKAA